MPPDSIETPESSNIAGASYDPAALMMTVDFRSGGSWEYSGIGPETWDSFKAAGSKGEFLHRQVKGVYAARKK